MTIAIVDSGSGNLRSVEKALARAGGEPFVSSDPEAIARADQIVVPGQGAFRDCMTGLGARGGALEQAVRAAIAAGKPYLGICLGLQVLFEESEERGPCRGLGILRGHVRRFPARPGLKVPHMGWNAVLPSREHYYFVHSYYAAPSDPDDIALSCEYGEPFCAAVRRDNIFAVQFHPEKSQAAGLRLLEQFVRS